MYKIKEDYCPVCNSVYRIKYSNLLNIPFMVLEIPDNCKHEDIIKNIYLDVKIVKKNKGLT